MPIEFYFTPELHLKDGRIIRDLEDAASFAREQEVRPGVDQRDEVEARAEAVRRGLAATQSSSGGSKHESEGDSGAASSA